MYITPGERSPRDGLDLSSRANCTSCNFRQICKSFNYLVDSRNPAQRMKQVRPSEKNEMKSENVIETPRATRSYCINI